MQNNPHIDKVALVTGGARRIGAAICRTLHARGMRIVIHYGTSSDEAEELSAELNAERVGSAITLQGELGDAEQGNRLVASAHDTWGRLDGLVNNASRFYPTPVGEVTTGDWQDIVGANLKAPFFLCQAAAERLKANGGGIVNIVDIYAERPLPDHPVYCASKAGLAMLTRALARDLAPGVRVNAVSPGAILWPESGSDEKTRKALLQRIPSGRLGEPSDIAAAVSFLLLDGNYVTGQVLAVDGGRSVAY